MSPYREAPPIAEDSPPLKRERMAIPEPPIDGEDLILLIMIVLLMGIIAGTVAQCLSK